MAFATASSPANRKPGDNTQTTTPPQAQARPRQSPGKTEPQRARPPRVQEPRARQTPPARTRPHQRAPGPERARTSAAHDRTPGARRDPRARQDRQRAPGRKPGGFAADHVLVSRTPPIARQTPARARTKTGLRSISRTKQRVPAAKNRQSCPAVVKTSDSSQTQGQNTRLFALSESPYANNRQKRPFLTSETAKNRLF